MWQSGGLECRYDGGVIGEIANLDLRRGLFEKTKKEIFRVVGKLSGEADDDDAAGLLRDEQRDPAEQDPACQRLNETSPEEP
jgi:hypothetical protein